MAPAELRNPSDEQHRRTGGPALPPRSHSHFMIKKDISKPRIHSAISYKLYLLTCLLTCSGLVLMLKFPEMHALEPGVDPLSFKVYGLSMKGWKMLHIFSSLAFLVLTALHIWFNRDWIRKVGTKKLSLNITVGLVIGIVIVVAGVVAPRA